MPSLMNLDLFIQLHMLILSLYLYSRLASCHVCIRCAVNVALITSITPGPIILFSLSVSVHLKFCHLSVH